MGVVKVQVAYCDAGQVVLCVKVSVFVGIKTLPLTFPKRTT